MRRWAWIGGVALAIALAEVGLLRLSAWLWRAHGAALEVVGASSLTFYVPWLLLLAVVAACWRPARAPWRPLVGTARTVRDRWIVGAGVLLAVGLYSGSLVQLLSNGVAPPVLPAYVLNGAVLAPVVEEWIFRGVLWRQLVAEEPGASRAAAQAIVVTSVAFALWHQPFQGHAPLYVHGLFGVSMALLRWRIGSVSPCVLVHGLGNLTSILAAG